MQIHYGVESKSNKMLCEKCEKNKNKKSPDPHCHCSIAFISEEMKLNCKNASKILKSEKDKEELVNSEQEISEKQKKVREKIEKKRKFKDELEGRDTFYKSSLMKSIYPDKSK